MTRGKKRRMAMVFGVSMAAMAGMCTVGVSAEEEKLVIGMAMNEEIDFVNELQNALKEQAEEAGDVEIIFTNANGDAEKQLSDIDSLIAQNPDVIVMRIVDSDAGVSCVEAVKDAGIACVIQDTTVNTDIYDCRIAGDQSLVGQLIGGYMQEWLDEDEDRMINMGYINGAASDTIKKRETGIYDVVDPQRINTFSTQIATGFSAEDAMAFAEGGTIGQQYLESGELDATVRQSVAKVADAIISVSRDVANGKEYENKIYDPQCYQLMTKDNMEEVLAGK